jgi:hypothetical protein
MRNRIVLFLRKRMIMLDLTISRTGSCALAVLRVPEPFEILDHHHVRASAEEDHRAHAHSERRTRR